MRRHRSRSPDLPEPQHQQHTLGHIACPVCDEIQRLSLSSEQLADLPFPQAALIWLDSRRDISEGEHSTRFMYGCYIKSLVKFFGELRLSKCADARLISVYQRDRQLGSLPGLGAAGPSVVNHELNTLQQILARAGLWNKLANWYEPLQQKPSRIGRALTDEEERRLFRIASERARWFVAYCCSLITANTTAGPGEIKKLQLQDVDLTARTIRTRLGAKNQRRDRWLELNGDAFWAVGELHRRAKENGCHLPEHYLLPHRAHVKGAGWNPLKPMGSWRTAWTALRMAAGLPTLRMYDLRHHAITRLLENPNVSERTVIELAGHVSGRMRDTYSHQRVEAKIAAVEALSRGQAPKSVPLVARLVEKA